MTEPTLPTFPKFGCKCCNYVPKDGIGTKQRLLSHTNSSAHLATVATIEKMAETKVENQSVVLQEKVNEIKIAVPVVSEERFVALTETVAALASNVSDLEVKNDKLKIKVKLLKAQFKELFASMKTASAALPAALPTVTHDVAPIVAPIVASAVVPIVAPATPKKKDPKPWADEFIARLRGKFGFKNSKTLSKKDDNYFDSNQKQLKEFIKVVKSIHMQEAFGKLDADEQHAIDEVVLERSVEFLALFNDEDVKEFARSFLGLCDLTTPISSDLYKFMYKKYIEAMERDPNYEPPKVVQVPKKPSETYIDLVQQKYSEADGYFEEIDYELKDELETLMSKMSTSSKVRFLDDILKFNYPIALTDMLIGFISEKYGRCCDLYEQAVKQYPVQEIVEREIVNTNDVFKEEVRYASNAEDYLTLPWPQVRSVAIKHNLITKDKEGNNDSSEVVRENVYNHFKLKEKPKPKTNEPVLVCPPPPEPDVKHSYDYYKRCSQAELIQFALKTPMYEGFTAGQMHNEKADTLRSKLCSYYERERLKCHPLRAVVYEEEPRLSDGAEQVLSEMRRCVDDVNGDSFFLTIKSLLSLSRFKKVGDGYEVVLLFDHETREQILIRFVKMLAAKLFTFHVYFQKYIIDQLNYINVDSDAYNEQLKDVRDKIYVHY